MQPAPDTVQQGREPARGTSRWPLAALGWITGARPLTWRVRRQLVAAVLVVAVVGSAGAWVIATPRPQPVALPDEPPYDHAPGRMPIPAPQPVDFSRQILGATLPWTGDSPAEPAARAAAGLVLGRWCRTPAAADVALDGTDRWQRVRVTVVPISGAAFQFLLRWDGSAPVPAYRLFGGPAPDHCG